MPALLAPLPKPRIKKLVLPVVCNCVTRNEGTRNCRPLTSWMLDSWISVAWSTDTATGISECVASFCRAATEILLVVGNAPASIRESVAQIEILSSEYGIDRFRIVTNMVKNAREGAAVFNNLLAEFADNHGQALSYAGFIPRDMHLVQAISGQASVVSTFPRSRSAMAIANLARQVMSWPYPVQAGGHVEFFVERLIQNENSGTEVTS